MATLGRPETSSGSPKLKSHRNVHPLCRDVALSCARTQARVRSTRALSMSHVPQLCTDSQTNPHLPSCLFSFHSRGNRFVVLLDECIRRWSANQTSMHQADALYSSSRSDLRTHPWSSDQTKVQEADAYYYSRSKDHHLARSSVSLRLACTPLGNRPDKCAPG